MHSDILNVVKEVDETFSLIRLQNKYFRFRDELPC